MKIVKSVDELMDVLGIKPGDKLNVITPQFEREYDLEIDFIPKDKVELDALINSAPQEVLKKMGVCVFTTHEEEIKYGTTYLGPDEIHYLFPGEWYSHIPNGYPTLTINGDIERFEKGVSDDDIRYGCLPYGFKRKF